MRSLKRIERILSGARFIKPSKNDGETFNVLQGKTNSLEMSIVKRLKPTNVYAVFMHGNDLPRIGSSVHIFRLVKIRLVELKRLIRNVLTEDYNSPTIPAALDPNEIQFSDAYPKWGNPQSKDLKRKSPAELRTKQAMDALAKMGLTKNAAYMKKITQELLSFVESMNPTELFTAEPQDIAEDFAQQILGVHDNLGTSLEGTSHHLFPVPVFGWDKLQVLFLDG